MIPFDRDRPLFFLDAETFSFAPLKKNVKLNGHGASCGADVYARHKTTRVLMWSYKTGLYGEPCLWDATDPATPEMPSELREGMEACARGDMYAVFWNGMSFDRRIILHKHGIDIPFRNCIDLMHLALLACLPASLAGCCEALRISGESAKMAEGKKLISLFCVPYKSRKRGDDSWLHRDRNTHPEQWVQFCEYGLRDTVAMAAIWRKIPKLNWNGVRGDFERQLIEVDAIINERGIRTDTALAIKARDTLAERRADVAESATEDYGISLTSNEQFLNALQAAWPSRKIPVSGKGAAAKGTLLEYMRDPDMPDLVREMIETRMEATSKGGSKFDMIITGTNSKGRYCDGYSYGSASRTLRWAGSRAGLMNMARGHYHDGDEGVWPWDDRELARGITLLNNSCAHWRYDINKLASSVTRACFLPDEGEVLQVSDFSNIEGRLAFHLAGGMRGVQKFIDADKGGPGVYELAAAGMFGISVLNVTKDQRQIGKLISLSCQYGSGVAGFCGFAKGYNFDVRAMCGRLEGTIPDVAWKQSASQWEFALLTKQNTAGLNEKQWRIVWCLIHLWRLDAERDAGLVTLWSALETSALRAIENPGRNFWAGQRVRADGKRAFRFEVPVRKGSGTPMPWLHMELPSGRVVMFAHPVISRRRKVGEDDDTQATGNKEIRFMGAHEETGVWLQQSLYGGKLMAIGTQATAREFQAESLVRVHLDGQKIVIHVHDEIGISVKPDTKYNLRSRSCIVPDFYDQRFPLTGSLDIMTEYRK